MKKRLLILPILIISQSLWCQTAKKASGNADSSGISEAAENTDSSKSSEDSVLQGHRKENKAFMDSERPSPPVSIVPQPELFPPPPKVRNPYSLPHKNPGMPDAFPPPAGPRMNSGNTGDFINFRGQRIKQTSEPLKISGSRNIITQNNNLEISIYFNQSINPLSLLRENILINGKKCSDDIDLFFSHKSDSLKIILKGKKYKNPNESVQIKILNLRTLDGKIAEELEIK